MPDAREATTDCLGRDGQPVGPELASPRRAGYAAGDRNIILAPAEKSRPVTSARGPMLSVDVEILKR